MKRIVFLTTAAATIAGLTLTSQAQEDSETQPQSAEQSSPAADTQPQTPADRPTARAEDGKLNIERVSYAIGYVMGRRYHQDQLELEADAYAEGLRAGLAGGEARVSQEEIEATLRAFEQQLQLREMQRMQERAARGQALLQENRTKEGVQVTESGLQFEVVEEGEGQSPGPQDIVRVHYRGTLADGTQFDSSYDRGQPAEFRVNEVIPGWSEALQMMKPGGEYRLVIPSELGYGEMSRSREIPPNSVLVFKVELLGVVQSEEE